MPDDELPHYVSECVRKLRSKGDKYQSIVDRLLQKRAAGSAEERRRVDESLVALAKPNRAGWAFAVIGLVAFAIVTTQLLTRQRVEEAVVAGVPVVAQVKRLDPGDCLIGQKGSQCLRLTVELYPEGAEPYAASLTQEINLQWVSRVQPGSWLTVSVARDDRSQVFFDERTMAVPPPVPPRRPN